MRKRRGLCALLALLWVASAALVARADWAELSPPREPVGPSGLPGGRYVGSAQLPARSLRLSSSVGYAYTGSVLNEGDRHHRLAGELYGAWLAHPAFQVSVGSELRADLHSTDSGDDRGLLAATRFTTRHALAVHSRLSLALQPGIVFPGAARASRSFLAASPELSLLAGYALSAASQIGLSLGYRIDRSEHVVSEPLALSRSDRLAASVSDLNAYLLGVVYSHSFKPVTALVEWSWDVAAGGAARSYQSPMRVRVAAQRLIGERFLPGIEAGLDTSSRPGFDELVRIEPRLWARLGLGVLLDRRPPKKSPPRAAAAPAAPTIVTSVSALVLNVSNEAGEPVAGARVAVARGPTRQEWLCDANGRVRIELPPGAVAVSVEAEGYEPQSQTFSVDGDEPQRVVLARGLPPAELKGAVRSLSGSAPLRARVEVLGTEQVVQTGSDGQFIIAVAPGHYTLRISADGHEPQERAVHVELRGVTILVIDLRRANK